MLQTTPFPLTILYSVHVPRGANETLPSLPPLASIKQKKLGLPYRDSELQGVRLLTCSSMKVNVSPTRQKLLCHFPTTANWPNFFKTSNKSDKTLWSSDDMDNYNYKAPWKSLVYYHSLTHLNPWLHQIFYFFYLQDSILVPHTVMNCLNFEIYTVQFKLLSFKHCKFHLIWLINPVCIKSWHYTNWLSSVNIKLKNK